MGCERDDSHHRLPHHGGLRRGIWDHPQGQSASSAYHRYGSQGCSLLATQSGGAPPAAAFSRLQRLYRSERARRVRCGSPHQAQTRHFLRAQRLAVGHSGSTASGVIAYADHTEDGQFPPGEAHCRPFFGSGGDSRLCGQQCRAGLEGFRRRARPESVFLTGLDSTCAARCDAVIRMEVFSRVRAARAIAES